MPDEQNARHGEIELDFPATRPDSPATRQDNGNEVSLDQLGETFARLYAGDAPLVANSPRSESLAESPDQMADDNGEVSPLRILEAMLFVGSPSNEPLSADRAASVLRGVEAEEVHDLVRQLNDEYASNRCPYHIVSQGPGYRLVLTASHERLREKFQGRQRQARLSQAAVEVLSLVAYHESLSRDEVTRMRNTPSGAVLTQLVRRQLLQLERSEEEPHVARYRTTQRFLDLFGLQDLADLPQTQDLA